MFHGATLLASLLEVVAIDVGLHPLPVIFCLYVEFLGAGDIKLFTVVACEWA